MVRLEHTRRESARARQAYGRTQAEQHGWSHSALPLRVTLGDALRAKASRPGELGDRAADALEAVGMGT